MKKKFIPKYKEGICFINPENLSFGCVLGISNTEYETVINPFPHKNYYTNYVSEQFLNNCVIISQEHYDDLYTLKNTLLSDIYKYHNKKNKEIKDFIDSLEKEFNYAIQEIINEYKNES